MSASLVILSLFLFSAGQASTLQESNNLDDFEWEAFGDEGFEGNFESFSEFFDRSDDEDKPDIPENPDPIDEPIYPSINETDRIIGGGFASRGEYPFAARLLQGNRGL